MYNDFFSKCTVWKADGSDFTGEKSDKPCPRWTRSTSTVVNSVHSMYFLYDMMEWHFTSVIFFPKSITLIEFWEKYQANFNRRSSYKITEQYGSTCKIVGYKESLRNCPSKEEPTETWQLKVMWGPGWNPGTGKGIS